MKLADEMTLLVHGGLFGLVILKLLDVRIRLTFLALIYCHLVILLTSICIQFVELLDDLQYTLSNMYFLFFSSETGLQSAKRVSKAFFEKDLNLLGSLSTNEITEVFEGATEYHLEFIPGQVTALDLALRTECFDSNLAAVNTIQDGGFYVNYVKICNPGTVLNEQFILANNVTIVSVGKRNHRLVRWI